MDGLPIKCKVIHKTCFCTSDFSISGSWPRSDVFEVHCLVEYFTWPLSAHIPMQIFDFEKKETEELYEQDMDDWWKIEKIMIWSENFE